MYKEVKKINVNFDFEYEYQTDLNELKEIIKEIIDLKNVKNLKYEESGK